MALHAGMRVGASWELGTKIADGGMGSVWRATHVEFGERRALKALHDFLLNDPSLCDKFLDEARNTRRVRHENVVEVIDCGRVEDPDAPPGSGRIIPWLVMELLEGHDLASEVSKHGADGLPPGRVSVLFRQLCAGLAAAHAQGVVHLDLKPENIFVARTSSGATQVKVVDFGISKVLRDAGQSVTLTGRMLSPVWAAPEQIQRTRVGPRTDVWALGLIAFRLLTGRYYWRVANAGTAAGTDPVMALVNEVVASFTAPTAASVRAQEFGAEGRLPAGFDAWFARCVCFDPSARFADVTTCGGALEALLLPHPHVPSLPSPPIRPTAPLVNLPRPPASPSGALRSGSPTLPLTAIDRSRALSSATDVDDSAEFVPTRRPSRPMLAFVVLGLAVAGTTFAVGAWLLAPDAPPPNLACPTGMARIPGGTFELVAAPGQSATVAPFCMDVSEVTAGAYAACFATGSCTAASARDDSRFCNADHPERAQHPINCVDALQAAAFCAWRGGRLPTEVEWEFAARGTDGRTYPWGEGVPDDRRLCWSRWQRGEGTCRVGSFPDGASPFGLLDMAGNVWEWTSSAAGEASRVARGGGWGSTQPEMVSAGYRNADGASERVDVLGFRCAR